MGLGFCQLPFAWEGLERSGLTITDDTEIVLLYFDLVEQFN